MLKSLFKPKTRITAVPEGMVVFAIGDIHGRADLLDAILKTIGEDLNRYRSHGVLIGMGDYIDRGDNSRGVLDRLIGLERDTSVETHFLCGNHEEALLDFLREPESGANWLQFGGRECLRSYGVIAPHPRVETDWTALRDEFAAALPDDHLKFLWSLESSFTLGDYFFAHAGARPGVPLDKQQTSDLLWIRDAFLNNGRDFEKIVVHGHSISPEAHIDTRRIGIDTGAYATGALTALRLEGQTRTLFQTRRRPEGGFYGVKLPTAA